MFDTPSGSEKRDGARRDASPAAPTPEGVRGAPAPEGVASAPAPEEAASKPEADGVQQLKDIARAALNGGVVRVNAAPQKTTREIAAAPLPPDAPDPAQVRSDDDGGVWLDVLEGPPGPQLLAELLEASPPALGDLDLVAALVAWERIGSWVAARHAEALGALAARAGRFGGIDQAAAILAAELRGTQRSAMDKLAWANTLGNFPAVAHALETGVVDVPKARVICEEALAAPTESAQEVAALGLALAPTKAPPQLRRALRAATLGLDPAAGAARAAQAKAARRGEFHQLPDAMAMIAAYLPATDAMAVKTALDALARTTGTEDPRTFDQRRADYLGAIFHALCNSGEAPLHPDHVFSAAGAAAGAGAGAATGPAAGPAAGAAAEPASDSAAESPVAGDTESPVCNDKGTRAPIPDLAVWRRLATTQRQRPHLQVTVAASTLLGLDDHPGDLTGYGPIPAAVARLIATDATWRAILTNPAGTVTAVGEKTYRPGAVLTRHVAARDRTCTFTGCSRPAAMCDIDHRIAYSTDRPAAEQTHIGNLHALCRFHHNLKTLHGWSPQFDPRTGVTTWTSPLGTRHERQPETPLPPWEAWLEQVESPTITSPCPCAAPPRGEVEDGLVPGENHTDSHSPGEPRDADPPKVTDPPEIADPPGCADPPKPEAPPPF